MLRQFSALITQEGSAYVAQCLDVDVVSDGPSPDEALANLREALELYFEDAPAGLAKAPCVRTVEVDVPSSVQTGT